MIFLFIRHGSYLLDDHFFQAIVAGLPQKARAAYDAVNHFQMPDMDGLRELNELWPERMRVFQRQADIDLDVLFAVSCLLLMGAAYLVAMRLASPIERIAEGSRRLAAGDLSVRIGSERLWGQEAQSLVGHSPSDIGRLILQVDALTRIVEDLRVLSLAAASELSVHRAPVDLADQAESVLDVVAPDLAALGMGVERDLRPAPMSGDGQRLGQAILALIDNSRRYGASGGLLRVETGLREGQVFLRVIDLGPGFPPGTETLAFEPFWRSDASRSRAAGGSGLGLAVVQAIVSAHRGAVTIAANTPTGAVVELRFDAAHAS